MNLDRVFTDNNDYLDRSLCGFLALQPFRNVSLFQNPDSINVKFDLYYSLFYYHSKIWLY